MKSLFQTLFITIAALFVLGSPVQAADHWISENHDGKVLELEDGSLWQISDYDQVDTALWLAMSDIDLTESSNPYYPYKLINVDDNETAEARRLR